MILSCVSQYNSESSRAVMTARMTKNSNVRATSVDIPGLTTPPQHRAIHVSRMDQDLAPCLCPTAWGRELCAMTEQWRTVLAR
jgi:hypothetical protein